MITIIPGSSKPFSHDETGYSNALRFLRSEYIDHSVNLVMDRNDLIDLANAHALDCNLLAIGYNQLQKIIYKLKDTPAVIWEKDVIIPETGQIVRFRRSLNDIWEPATPVLYIPEKNALF